MLILSIFENKLKNTIASMLPKTKKITEIDPENGNIIIKIEKVNPIQIINNSPFIKIQIKSAVDAVKYIKENGDININTPINVITSMGPGTLVKGQIIPKALE